MVGVIAILLAESRTLSMERLRLIPSNGYVRTETGWTVGAGCGKSCEQLDPTLSGNREV